MRRQSDNWVNATHILKAAALDKPARTRILERDVQKGNHEKVQGGYGKFQGTLHPSLFTLAPMYLLVLVLKLLRMLTLSSHDAGTYLPLQDARELARQHNVLDRLRPIFDFVPGAVTPPPAPRHASKPKQPKKPAGGLLQQGHGVKRKRKGV